MPWRRLATAKPRPISKPRRMYGRALLGKLGISAATLRRDLNHLDPNNQVFRVHGGVLLPGGNPEEATLRLKAVTAIQAKRRIAARIVETNPQGASVFIDGGTTCLEAELILRTRADLSIISNSLPRRYLLADATKWNQHSSIRYAGWNEFAGFHTDRPPPPEFRSKTIKIIIS